MITQDRLKQLLHYNPDTGIFTRLIATSNNTKVGDIVGSKHHTGYLYAMIDYKTYSIHHLAWLYVYGEFPKLEIDHINGIKNDNKISNLRDVDKTTNMQNEVRARINSSSGLLGVRWRNDRNKWIASIRVNGKVKRLGSFDNKIEAYECYLEAKRLYHQGFTL